MSTQAGHDGADAANQEVPAASAADATSGERQRISRRELARLAAATSGVLAIETILPTSWLTPIVHATHLPTHALGSTPGGGFDIKVTKLPPGVHGSTALPPAHQGTAGMAGDGSAGMAGNGTAGSAGSSGSGGSGGSAGSAGQTGTSGVQPGSAGAPGAGNPCPTNPGGPATPSTPSISNVDSSSANVSWSAGGTDTTYTITATSTTAPTVTVSGLRTTNGRLTGLRPCTSYLVTITALRCGMTVTSPVPQGMTTQPDLSGPTLQMLQLACDAATVTWTFPPCGNSTVWHQAEIAEEGGSWNWGGGGFENKTTITGLCPGKNYVIRVRTYYYQGGVYSMWRELPFTTPLRTANRECKCSSSQSGGSGSSGGSQG